MHGTARGFAPNPFLPVLVRSPGLPGVVAWSSEGSEFEVAGLPGGLYRTRHKQCARRAGVRFSNPARFIRHETALYRRSIGITLGTCRYYQEEVR